MNDAAMLRIATASIVILAVEKILSIRLKSFFAKLYATRGTIPRQTPRPIFIGSLSTFITMPTDARGISPYETVSRFVTIFTLLKSRRIIAAGIPTE